MTTNLRVLCKQHYVIPSKCEKATLHARFEVEVIEWVEHFHTQLSSLQREVESVRENLLSTHLRRLIGLKLDLSQFCSSHTSIHMNGEKTRNYKSCRRCVWWLDDEKNAQFSGSVELFTYPFSSSFEYEFLIFNCCVCFTLYTPLKRVQTKDFLKLFKISANFTELSCILYMKSRSEKKTCSHLTHCYSKHSLMFISFVRAHCAHNF